MTDTKTTQWVRQTGRGADYFGPCDCCNKSGGGEFFALMQARCVDDMRLLAPTPVAYGHSQCIEARRSAFFGAA